MDFSEPLPRTPATGYMDPSKKEFADRVMDAH